MDYDYINRGQSIMSLTTVPVTSYAPTGQSWSGQKATNQYERGESFSQTPFSFTGSNAAQKNYLTDTPREGGYVVGHSYTAPMEDGGGSFYRPFPQQPYYVSKPGMPISFSSRIKYDPTTGSQHQMPEKNTQQETTRHHDTYQWDSSTRSAVPGSVSVSSRYLAPPTFALKKTLAAEYSGGERGSLPPLPYSPKRTTVACPPYQSSAMRTLPAGGTEDAASDPIMTLPYHSYHNGQSTASYYREATAGYHQLPSSPWAGPAYTPSALQHQRDATSMLRNARPPVANVQPQYSMHGKASETPSAQTQSPYRSHVFSAGASTRGRPVKPRAFDRDVPSGVPAPHFGDYNELPTMTPFTHGGMATGYGHHAPVSFPQVYQGDLSSVSGVRASRNSMIDYSQQAVDDMRLRCHSAGASPQTRSNLSGLLAGGRSTVRSLSSKQRNVTVDTSGFYRVTGASNPLAPQGLGTTSGFSSVPTALGCISPGVAAKGLVKPSVAASAARRREHFSREPVQTMVSPGRASPSQRLPALTPSAAEAVQGDASNMSTWAPNQATTATEWSVASHTTAAVPSHALSSGQIPNAGSVVQMLTPFNISPTASTPSVAPPMVGGYCSSQSDQQAKSNDAPKIRLLGLVAGVGDLLAAPPAGKPHSTLDGEPRSTIEIPRLRTSELLVTNDHKIAVSSFRSAKLTLTASQPQLPATQEPAEGFAAFAAAAEARSAETRDSASPISSAAQQSLSKGRLEGPSGRPIAQPEALGPKESVASRKPGQEVMTTALYGLDSTILPHLTNITGVFGGASYRTLGDRSDSGSSFFNEGNSSLNGAINFVGASGFSTQTDAKRMDGGEQIQEVLLKVSLATTSKESVFAKTFPIERNIVSKHRLSFPLPLECECLRFEICGAQKSNARNDTGRQKEQWEAASDDGSRDGDSVPKSVEVNLLDLLASGQSSFSGAFRLKALNGLWPHKGQEASVLAHLEFETGRISDIFVETWPQISDALASATPTPPATRPALSPRQHDETSVKRASRVSVEAESIQAVALSHSPRKSPRRQDTVERLLASHKLEVRDRQAILDSSSEEGIETTRRLESSRIDSSTPRDVAFLAAGPSSGRLRTASGGRAAKAAKAPSMTGLQGSPCKSQGLRDSQNEREPFVTSRRVLPGSQAGLMYGGYWSLQSSCDLQSLSKSCIPEEPSSSLGHPSAASESPFFSVAARSPLSVDSSTPAPGRHACYALSGAENVTSPPSMQGYSAVVISERSPETAESVVEEKADPITEMLIMSRVGHSIDGEDVKDTVKLSSHSGDELRPASLKVSNESQTKQTLTSPSTPVTTQLPEGSFSSRARGAAKESLLFQSLTETRQSSARSASSCVTSRVSVPGLPEGAAVVPSHPSQVTHMSFTAAKVMGKILSEFGREEGPVLRATAMTDAVEGAVEVPHIISMAASPHYANQTLTLELFRDADAARQDNPLATGKLPLQPLLSEFFQLSKLGGVNDWQQTPIIKLFNRDMTQVGAVASEVLFMDMNPNYRGATSREHQKVSDSVGGSSLRSASHTHTPLPVTLSAVRARRQSADHCSSFPTPSLEETKLKEAQSASSASPVAPLEAPEPAHFQENSSVYSVVSEASSTMPTSSICSPRSLAFSGCDASRPEVAAQLPTAPRLNLAPTADLIAMAQPSLVPIALDDRRWAAPEDALLAASTRHSRKPGSPQSLADLRQSSDSSVEYEEIIKYESTGSLAKWRNSNEAAAQNRTISSEEPEASSTKPAVTSEKPAAGATKQALTEAAGGAPIGSLLKSFIAAAMSAPPRPQSDAEGLTRPASEGINKEAVASLMAALGFLPGSALSPPSAGEALRDFSTSSPPPQVVSPEFQVNVLKPETALEQETKERHGIIMSTQNLSALCATTSSFMIDSGGEAPSHSSARSLGANESYFDYAYYCDQNGPNSLTGSQLIDQMIAQFADIDRSNLTAAGAETLALLELLYGAGTKVKKSSASGARTASLTQSVPRKESAMSWHSVDSRASNDGEVADCLVTQTSPPAVLRPEVEEAEVEELRTFPHATAVALTTPSKTTSSERPANPRQLALEALMVPEAAEAKAPSFGESQRVVPPLSQQLLTQEIAAPSETVQLCEPVDGSTIFTPAPLGDVAIGVEVATMKPDPVITIDAKLLEEKGSLHDIGLSPDQISILKKAAKDLIVKHAATIDIAGASHEGFVGPRSSHSLPAPYFTVTTPADLPNCEKDLGPLVQPPCLRSALGESAVIPAVEKVEGSSATDETIPDSTTTAQNSRGPQIISTDSQSPLGGPLALSLPQKPSPSEGEGESPSEVKPTQIESEQASSLVGLDLKMIVEAVEEDSEDAWKEWREGSPRHLDTIPRHLRSSAELGEVPVGDGSASNAIGSVANVGEPTEKAALMKDEAPPSEAVVADETSLPHNSSESPSSSPDDTVERKLSQSRTHLLDCLLKSRSKLFLRSSEGETPIGASSLVATSFCRETEAPKPLESFRSDLSNAATAFDPSASIFDRPILWDPQSALLRNLPPTYDNGSIASTDRELDLTVDGCAVRSSPTKKNVTDNPKVAVNRDIPQGIEGQQVSEQEPGESLPASETGILGGSPTHIRTGPVAATSTSISLTTSESSVVAAKRSSVECSNGETLKLTSEIRAMTKSEPSVLQCLSQNSFDGAKPPEAATVGPVS